MKKVICLFFDISNVWKGKCKWWDWSLLKTRAVSKFTIYVVIKAVMNTHNCSLVVFERVNPWFPMGVPSWDSFKSLVNRVGGVIFQQQLCLRSSNCECKSWWRLKWGYVWLHYDLCFWERSSDSDFRREGTNKETGSSHVNMYVGSGFITSNQSHENNKTIQIMVDGKALFLILLAYQTTVQPSAISPHPSNIYVKVVQTCKQYHIRFG